MVLRCTNLEMCQAVKHKNHTKSTVKNIKNGVQCTMLRKQQNTPRRLKNTIRSKRNQKNDKQKLTKPPRTLKRTSESTARPTRG
jgi:hypothetical protein